VSPLDCLVQCDELVLDAGVELVQGCYFLALLSSGLEEDGRGGEDSLFCSYARLHLFLVSLHQEVEL
jgi:hypothetical protein